MTCCEDHDIPNTLPSRSIIWVLTSAYTVTESFCRWLSDLVPEWCSAMFSWCPTSATHLEEAESKILYYVSRPFKAFFATISSLKGCSGTQLIRTLVMDPDPKYSDGENNCPIVLIHGFGAGCAMWMLNLDALSEKRRVYAFDTLGFGRSSRSRFPNDAYDAESQFVQSIEEWRKSVGLERRFILVGHSLGGYLSASYAIRYPQNVAHLVLVDPWGFPAKAPHRERHLPIPLWAKVVIKILHPFNPLGILRVMGPFGPRMIERFRPDLRRKFDHVIQDQALISNYLYHCNVQKPPTGEAAFKCMTTSLGWAKRPMQSRIIHELSPDVPITFIYGSRSWVDIQPGVVVKHSRVDAVVDVQVIDMAGHHVYADKPAEFNALVNSVADGVDLMERRRVDDGDVCEQERESSGADSA